MRSSPALPNSLSRPCSPSIVSLPSPPMIQSAPSPPFAVSSPAPSHAMSRPAPSVTVSLPASARTRSGPPLASIVSASGVPLILSWWSVPLSSAANAIPAKSVVLVTRAASGAVSRIRLMSALTEGTDSSCAMASLIALRLALLTVLAALVAAGSIAPDAQPQAPAKPNVVFILTDDLSWNLVQYMPNVRQMQRDGMTFTNYFVTDSLCCPSRASIFTGRYPHNHGVLTNTAPVGGFAAFRRFGEE